MSHPVIEVADARALPLPDASVGLNVTSPPYAINVGYPLGDIPPADWPRYMADMLAEAYRVAEPAGRLCLNVPFDAARPWPPRDVYSVAVRAALAAGWQWRSLIVWNEDNVSKSTARGSIDSPSAPYVIARVEAISVFYKPPCWKRPRPVNVRSDLTRAEWLAWTSGLWTFPGVRKNGHPAPFPDELARRCIKLFSWPGDVVLDQHVGSGTSVRVASAHGRAGIGYDRELEYVEQARRACGLQATEEEPTA